MITRKTPAHSRSEQQHKGFTLTEIAIVLGIIGLILGAIWAAASGVYANLKANQGQQGLLAAAQATRSMFATSANTGQAAPTNITSPGMFPVSWQSETAGLIGNPWHLNPGVNNYAGVVGSGQQFAVEIDGISDAGCASLSGFYNKNASSQSGGAIPGLVSSANSAAMAAGFGTVAAPALPGIIKANFAAAANFPTAAANQQWAAPNACTGGSLNDAFVVFFDMSIM